MKGSEHQVSRLGRFDRRFGSFQITHLAHKHHIRVLPKSRSQCGLEALGVAMNLALVHEAPFVCVHELDRILNCHDMVGTVLVDVIDHCRQCG